MIHFLIFSIKVKKKNMTYSLDINNREPEIRRYTLEEYFEFEYATEGKHEFYDGEIVDVSYTSENHGIINSNLIYVFNQHYRKLDYSVFGRNRMVYVPSYNNIIYPDLCVIGKHEFYEYKKIHATLNPIIVVNVSVSTRNHYRKRIVKCCRTIPSLKQYIIVDQDTKFVEVYERSEDGHWFSEIYSDDDDMVKIGDCQILLKDIYHKVELSEGESKSDN